VTSLRGSTGVISGTAVTGVNVAVDVGVETTAGRSNLTSCSRETEGFADILLLEMRKLG
jgi:hypothetical protein